MTVEKVPINSHEQWLALRKTVLTASDVAAAAGVDPYKSALDVHLEKMGKHTVVENALMRRGRILEDAALTYLKEDLPDWRFLQPKALLLDRKRRLGCTPDALGAAFDDPDRLVNVQLKVVAKPTFESWDGVPPLNYRLQTICENMLLDSHTGMLACLVIDAWSAELHRFEIARNAAAEAKIEEIAEAFWDRIRRNVLPAVDHARDGETVRRVFAPNVEDVEVMDLTTDNRIHELVGKRIELKRVIGEAETEVGAIDTEIITKLSGAQRATTGTHRITWKTSMRKGYVVEPGEVSRLTISEIKE